ncbi:MAG TPA: protein TolR [Dongiaceae bacterium]|nr:protein TolR [Dongiaceae bacterium]
MGAALSGPKRHRRGGRRRADPVAAINVTPMVDVMLVLLVIFMITAPLLSSGIPVNLPKVKAEAMNNPDEPLVISVNKDGKVYLSDTEIPMESLGPRLAAITNNNPDAKIFIRGDKDINYGTVLQAMGELTTAGFRSVSLVVETPGDDNGSGANGTAQGGTASQGGAAKKPSK